MQKRDPIRRRVLQPTQPAKLPDFLLSPLDPLRKLRHRTTAPRSPVAAWNSDDAVVDVDADVRLLVRGVAVHVVWVEGLVGPAVLGAAGQAFEDDAPAHGGHG